MLPGFGGNRLNSRRGRATKAFLHVVALVVAWVVDYLYSQA